LSGLRDVPSLRVSFTVAVGLLTAAAIAAASPALADDALKLAVG